jgi:hypothetical protein
LVPLGLGAQAPSAPGVIELEAVEVTAQKRVQSIQEQSPNNPGINIRGEPRLYGASTALRF